MTFELQPLPYEPDALEPYIDATTMQIHHAKHHKTYTDKLNKAIEGTDLELKSIEFIIKNVGKYSTTIRNNGGGYYNHDLFWSMLTPNSSGEPSGEISTAIQETFGDFEAFKEKFTEAALNHFGSGWAWLCKDNKKKLFISTTSNQDNPLMDVIEEAQQGIPILGVDIWEHAYYLKYQNRRVEYLESFWKVVDWEAVNGFFLAHKP